MTTEAMPQSVISIARTQFNALPPIQRGPALREQIAEIRGQVADAAADLAVAESECATEQGRRNAAAAAALAAGRPAPSFPEMPQDRSGPIRTKLGGLNAYLAVLVKLERDVQDDEEAAVRVQSNELVASLRTKAAERHRRLLDGLIALLREHAITMSTGYAVTTIQGFIDEIQSRPSPEFATYRTWTEDLAERHPRASERLFKEASSRLDLLAGTKVGNEAVKAAVCAAWGAA
jgi:hypothetical protein